MLAAYTQVFGDMASFLGELNTGNLEESSFVHTAEWYSSISYSKFSLVKFPSAIADAGKDPNIALANLS